MVMFAQFTEWGRKTHFLPSHSTRPLMATQQSKWRMQEHKEESKGCPHGPVEAPAWLHKVVRTVVLETLTTSTHFITDVARFTFSTESLLWHLSGKVGHAGSLKGETNLQATLLPNSQSTKQNLQAE